MLTTRVLLAVLVLTGTLAGCSGDDSDDDQDRFGPARPTSSAEQFRELEQRPLNLPTIDLGRGSIVKNPPGNCIEKEDGGVPLFRGQTAPGPRDGAWAAHFGSSMLDPVDADLPLLVYLALYPKVGRWYVLSTVWLSRPSYDGPVLVRGGRMDAPGLLRFGPSRHPHTDLRLPAGDWPPGGWPRWVPRPPPGTAWRATGVSTLIPGPGCYTLRVDGDGFSYLRSFGVDRGPGGALPRGATCRDPGARRYEYIEIVCPWVRPPST